MAIRLFCWTVALVGAAWSAGAAQTFVAHGLTNNTLGNAIYSSNQFFGFIVSNLGTNGTDGLSLDLGQADSAVFVYPGTDQDPVTGSFMAGRLYGSVNGETNRLISFMRCHEQADGYHPVAIDLSGLAPAHLTFHAFRQGVKVAETGPQPGSMVVYGTYFVPYYPRVNPFWRMPDGSVGALIEFPEPADMSLPGLGYDISADRVFIRAEQPTNVVDFASRLEITAWLPYFQILDARLGVFHRPHRALGEAHLHAQPGMLEVANLGTNAEDGVAIELNTAVRFDAAFTPIQLETNAQLTLLALGSFGQGSNDALGSAQAARLGNSLELSAHLDIATNALVVVYRNGAPMGTAAGTNALVPASATVVGCELHTKVAEGQPGLVWRLGQEVAVTLPDQTSVSGDEIRFTGHGQSALLTMLALNAKGLEEFTLVSETELPLPLPRLQIVRSGSQLTLSWDDPYRVFTLEATGVEGGFYRVEEAPVYAGDRATVTLQIDLENAAPVFYRLNSAPRLLTEE